MTAILSPCGMYRYRLERDVAMTGPVFAFFGINPSTADATVDDATVRKWAGFTRVWGGSRFIVGNVFALRATDVRDLGCADAPIGPENRQHLESIVRDADVLVPCWGNRAKVPQQIRHTFNIVLNRLLATGKPVKCFGLTASGDPKHPLMLGYDTELIDWEPTP